MYLSQSARRVTSAPLHYPTLSLLRSGVAQYMLIPLLYSVLYGLSVGAGIRVVHLRPPLGRRRSWRKGGRSARRSDYTPTTGVIVFVRETRSDPGLSRGTNWTATLARISSAAGCLKEYGMVVLPRSSGRYVDQICSITNQFSNCWIVYFSLKLPLLDLMNINAVACTINKSRNTELFDWEAFSFFMFANITTLIFNTTT